LHDWFIIVDAPTNVNEKEKRSHILPTFIFVVFKPLRWIMGLSPVGGERSAFYEV
jgi:hypothetical protein